MLIEMLIAAACANGGVYQEACKKAMEAGSKQSGVYQTAQKTEEYAGNKTLNTVTSVTGEAPVAVAAFGFKTYKDKAIVYKIKAKQYLPVDTITTKIGADQGGNGSVNLEWRF